LTDRRGRLDSDPPTLAFARAAFGKDRILCTEYGSRDDTAEDEGNPEMERELAELMLRHFREPDLMMSHMFWNNYATAAGASQAWYHGLDITPKGAALLGLLFPAP
jgi:hypothetical protein